MTTRQLNTFTVMFVVFMGLIFVSANAGTGAQEPSIVFQSSKPISPVLFRGEPHFIISTYGQPSGDWTPWISAGGNTVQFNVNLNSTNHLEQVRKDLEACEKYQIPCIFYVYELYSKGKDAQLTTTTFAAVTRGMATPEDIPGKIESLKRLVEITGKNPWVLGYYFFDEPENYLYKEYGKLKDIKKWEEQYDNGLGSWIADGFKWVYETMKEGDPDAYVFVLPGWYTTYASMGPLYDILQANEYPQAVDVPPLTGDLYAVVADACHAASAIRKNGRTSFIYMPLIRDLMVSPDVYSKGQRPGTLKETRYTFFAPVTQGAMGINAWVLYRTTERYREAVVYPVLREVKRFVPWFLGKWHDEKVRSDHDTATRDYLKKYPARLVEVMNDQKVAQETKMDRVPDCSYMLRENPRDKSYLLLAVNNCKESIDVTFTFRDLPLTDKALEMLDYYRLPIVDNKLTDHFTPFEVRAYIIQSKK